MNAQPQCLRCESPRTALDARFCQICGARLMPLDTPDDPLVGAVLLGRYRVVGLLGEGGMGRVYLGEQRVGEATRRVAIKVLASARGHDAYIIARFRREAATIASLDHPNVIRIHDYGEEDGRFFSVMEYVPGGSLGDLMARGPLDPARVEGIAWQIAGGLDEAHRHGVVHRDLKPENILVSRSPDGRDVVKVVDFGIARRPPGTPGEKPLTASGSMLGTPAYMSPEQYLGAAVDARADVYALALVIYQLLAGRAPWTAVSVMEWADAHLRIAPTPLSSQPGCAGLPARYDAALAHGLAKRPEDRTPTATDLARELTGSTTPADLPRPAVTPPDGGYTPTVLGGPRRSAQSLRPSWPLRPSRPWLGMAVFALGSVVFGYAAVRGVLVLTGRAGAVEHMGELPTVTSGPWTDAGGTSPARSDPARSRAMDTLRAGLAAAAQERYEPAVSALETLRGGGRLTSAEIEPLRAAVERLGVVEVARVLATSCQRAQTTTRRLARVGAAASAEGLFTRRCHSPG